MKSRRRTTTTRTRAKVATKTTRGVLLVLSYTILLYR
jgi:hypothetical protein